MPQPPRPDSPPDDHEPLPRFLIVTMVESHASFRERLQSGVADLGGRAAPSRRLIETYLSYAGSDEASPEAMAPAVLGLVADAVRERDASALSDLDTEIFLDWAALGERAGSVTTPVTAPASSVRSLEHRQHQQQQEEEMVVESRYRARVQDLEEQLSAATQSRDSESHRLAKAHRDIEAMQRIHEEELRDSAEEKQHLQAEVRSLEGQFKQQKIRLDLEQRNNSSGMADSSRQDMETIRRLTEELDEAKARGSDHVRLYNEANTGLQNAEAKVWELEDKLRRRQRDGTDDVTAKDRDTMQKLEAENRALRDEVSQLCRKSLENMTKAQLEEWITEKGGADRLAALGKGPRKEDLYNLAVQTADDLDAAAGQADAQVDPGSGSSDESEAEDYEAAG